MTNSKLIYIEDDQILGNLITQALVGNDSSEESLNNVISQFRKKFRSDEHIHISTHPCIGYQLDSWRTTQPGETEPDSASPGQQFLYNSSFAKHHSGHRFNKLIHIFPHES
jgi:DNA-binding winged helix-turn-helix (wHTH) protein